MAPGDTQTRGRPTAGQPAAAAGACLQLPQSPQADREGGGSTSWRRRDDGQPQQPAQVAMQKVPRKLKQQPNRREREHLLRKLYIDRHVLWESEEGLRAGMW